MQFPKNEQEEEQATGSETAADRKKRLLELRSALLQKKAPPESRADVDKVLQDLEAALPAQPDIQAKKMNPTDAAQVAKVEAKTEAPNKAVQKPVEPKKPEPAEVPVKAAPETSEAVDPQPPQEPIEQTDAPLASHADHPVEETPVAEATPDHVGVPTPQKVPADTAEPEPTVTEVDQAPSNEPVAAIEQPKEPETPKEPQEPIRSAFVATALISKLKARAKAEKIQKTEPAKPSVAENASPEALPKAPDPATKAPDAPVVELTVSPQEEEPAPPPSPTIQTAVSDPPQAKEPDNQIQDAPQLAAEPEQATVEPPQPEPVAVPGPVTVPSIDDPGEGARKAKSTGRKPKARAKKTRRLGFHTSDGSSDPFAEKSTSPVAVEAKFPTGWVVITDGPGCGECFALSRGAHNIGRGEDQLIRLDFGDTSISRQDHAAIAYDAEENQFFLAQGGKANLIRLNGRPVLSNEILNHGDDLRIGQTTLRLIAVCGGTFSWGDEEGSVS